jgi:hypothetical protein
MGLFGSFIVSVQESAATAAITIKPGGSSYTPSLSVALKNQCNLLIHDKLYYICQFSADSRQLSIIRE